MSEQGLFPASLVSPEVAASLPAGYAIRALRRSDFATGFLDCLRVLTTVGDVTAEAFEKQYDAMAGQEGYYILVVEDTSRGVIVGTGALIVEKKLCVLPSPSLFPPLLSLSPSLSCSLRQNTTR